MDDEATVLERLKAALNVREEIPGVLVGKHTQQEIATKNPDQFDNLRYLINEWEYVYLTKEQFNEIKNINSAN